MAHEGEGYGRWVSCGSYTPWQRCEVGGKGSRVWGNCYLTAEANRMCGSNDVLRMLNVQAYDQFYWNLRMLNESMGLCIR